jgi:diguanylate cyclase (GGDEF)-like protein
MIRDMKNVLITEDSKFIRILLKDALQSLHVNTLEADSRKAAQEHIKSNEHIHVAILGLQLSDDSNALIDDLIARNIPVLILTGTINEKTKRMILQKPIEDYIPKENPRSIDDAVLKIKHILKRYDTTILVVDDSKTERARIGEILKSLHVKVAYASSGKEAINYMHVNPVHLVINDYIMPEMDGLEFVLQVRRHHKKESLGIITISASDEEAVASQFLKIGANDFLKKPYNPTELRSRVVLNLELLSLIDKIQALANEDFLTGLCNRRHFDQRAAEILTSNSQNKILLLMLDIDHFKTINDTHGHGVGDEVIKHLASLLREYFDEQALVARIGGEEFCVVLQATNHEISRALCENLLKKINQNPFHVGRKEPLHVSVSIGAYHGQKGSLKKIMKLADENLYHAKNSGRNQVVFTSA